ncbi:hypothetical protein TrLO_g9182 [Triparma laevis f. longispina]|uniref:Tetratricopeptide repeat protein n=1 Tax=Triparma laevis f. longispina TaxID=1714387 RepID=A0A9W7FIM0_9STRA|nr:hypothetical protein TrLO_g9182 [Triparma laevis f. longispina]
MWKTRLQKKKADPKKVEIWDACAALGMACGFVGGFYDARRYYERAKEEYEEQLGHESEKALDATYSLTMSTGMSDGEIIEKLRDLLKTMERVLGEENVVTLETLNSLGCRLRTNGQFEEAKEVLERCLAEKMTVIGEDHKDTFASLANLGTVYVGLKNYEKALEYYERAFRRRGC